MKKNRLVMIFLLIPLIGYAQNTNVNIYKNIYKYLIKNELNEYKNVGISNEIVFIEYSSFINKESMINQVDSLNKLDSKIKFKPYLIHNLNKKIGAAKSLHNILYFSEPYKGYLIVDFVNSKRKIVGNYKKTTMFGELKRYLFKIDKFKIEKIAEVEMANN